MFLSLRTTLSSLKIPGKSSSSSSRSSRSSKSSTYTQSNSSYTMSNEEEDADSIFSPKNYRASRHRRGSSLESVDVVVGEGEKKTEKEGGNGEGRVSGSKRSNGGKGTGFPEPFNNYRNTTLPHPDADTSPNATIEADLSLSRTHSRRTFLERIHHRNHQSHNLSKEEIGISRNQSQNQSMVYLEEEEDISNGEREGGGMYEGIVYEDGSTREEERPRERQKGDNERAEESIWDEGKFDSGVIREKRRNPLGRFLH